MRFWITCTENVGKSRYVHNACFLYRNKFRITIIIDIKRRPMRPKSIIQFREGKGMIASHDRTREAQIMGEHANH